MKFQPVSITTPFIPRYLSDPRPPPRSTSLWSKIKAPFQVSRLPVEVQHKALAQHRLHTGTEELIPREMYEPPEKGDKVTLGMLIAMPDHGFVHGKEEDRVREVYLGLLGCSVSK
jgi:hypothetical protein